MVRRIGHWVRANTPDRESLGSSKWLGPFGKHVTRSELWRFTRRSVPRGVAVGLLIGIFLMIPGLQIIGAALMCVPVRGNIPIAAAMTFLSMPATTPFILVASIAIGNALGWHADLSTFSTLYERGATVGEWIRWLASDAAPSLVVGLFVLGSVAAAIGYVVSAVGWRLWIARKWRGRGHHLRKLTLQD
jgi:uncharacterized protein (DUF2062 family)